MQKKYIIALDQGTTSSRAIIFDKKAQIVSMSQQEFKQVYPNPGWVEHNPIEILETQIQVLNEALNKAKINIIEIDSIGITNQRETVVVWDKTTGKPIYNAIVWQDTRTNEYCSKLKANEAIKKKIHTKTGLIIDAYFSATKIKWILEQTDIPVENLIVGTIDTWLIWNLTERKQHLTDASNASRTMLYNIINDCWDDELLDLFNIPKNILPEVKNSSDNFGTYKINGVEIPICGVAGDQQAALFGQACFSSGMAKNTYGTGCFMLLNTGDKINYSTNGLLTTIAWKLNNQLVYALEGSVFVAGAAIQWLRDGLRIINSAEETENMAISSDNEEVYVVPAFAGLGAPYWDMNAKGAIYGLTRDVDRGTIVKATLNALAYQTKDVLETMEKDSGVKLTKLNVDGGASQNNYLMQFQADILGVDINKPKNHETTAKGAVFLSGLKTGFWTKQDLDGFNEEAKLFSSKMDETKREKLYKGWLEAVNRTKS